MMILERIVEHKREEVAAAKARCPEREMRARMPEAPPVRAFRRALLEAPDPVALIAEVKRASPSKGLIRSDFDPVAIAREYEAHGATAVSVLTDERFFHGSLSYLERIRQAVGLPVLRKEFIIDRYQLFESRAAGADAVLLIVACLAQAQLEEYLGIAAELGMDALVEVHDEDELQRALAAGANLIGINNRNLRTFETTLAVTQRLAPAVPRDVPFVSESGIFTRTDVITVQKAGARAVLVGEALMRQQHPGRCVTYLLGRGEAAVGNG